MGRVRTRRLPGLALGLHVTGQDLRDEQYMASIHAVAGEGAAGLAVEVHYLEFHPGVAARAGAGRARARNLDADLASLRTLGVSVWVNDFGCDGIGDETVAAGSNVDVVKLAMALLGWERGRLAGWSNDCTTTASWCSRKASSPRRTSGWRWKRASTWRRATATPRR